MKSTIAYILMIMALCIGCCLALVVPVFVAYAVYRIASRYINKD